MNNSPHDYRPASVRQRQALRDLDAFVWAVRPRSAGSWLIGAGVTALLLGVVYGLVVALP